MSKSHVLLALGATLFLGSSALLLRSAPRSAPRTAPGLAVDSSKAQRSFAFTYQVHVPADAAAKSSRLWIPLPQNDAFQSVSNLKIESGVAHSEGRDPEYKNPFAVFT